MMSVTLGENLIVNGGAEAVSPPVSPALGAPPPSSLVPGWDVDEAFEAVRYGAPGMPSATSPGPATRGEWLFGGGKSQTQPRTADTSVATQDIDISSIAADVDAGRIVFNLSAFLGGYGPEKDNMKVTLGFINPKVPPVPGSSLEGPTPSERGNVTGMVQKFLGGDVPIGTRKIRVQLVATKAYGKYIDGFADNLDLRLSSQMPVTQGVLTGRVLVDGNGNGRVDKGEPGGGGVTVFADLDRDGKLDAGEPAGDTPLDGQWMLSGLPTGPVVIRCLPREGLRATGPMARTVSVRGGLTTHVPTFLVSATGVITGHVFVDWNGNGKREARDGDGPRDGVSVFLDLDNDGKLDANEPRTRTDAKGNFRFVAQPGRYTIRQRESANFYKQSLPAKRKGINISLAPGGTSIGNLFGLEPIPQ